MKIRAIVLTVVVTLSMVTAGAGAALAATGNGVPQLDQTASSVTHREETTNSTDVEYVRAEPTQEYLDKPVDLDSAPDDFASFDSAGASGGTSAGASGGTSAGALASASSDSIIVDHSDDATDHPDVGTTKFFLTLRNGSYVFTKFTLLAVGDHSEVWVANDLRFPGEVRPDPTISEAQAEAFRTQFDDTIYPIESRVFGTPEERFGTNSLLEKLGAVPNDYYKTSNVSKTVILVHNIWDKNFFNSSYPLYIAGYFAPLVEQYTDRNVINIDAYGWDEVNATDNTVGYEGTLAHEYQHLIHSDLDPDETTWVDEGMADFAEYVTGYGVPGHLQYYEQLPSNSLTNWEDQGALNVLADYGVAYTFQMYLNDRFGTDFISNLAHENANGITGVEATLDEIGANLDFYGLYQDFSTAAVTDDIPLPPTDVFHIDGITVELNTSPKIGTAGAWGTNYRTIDTSVTGEISEVTLTGIGFIGTQWTNATDPADGQGQVLYSGSGNLLDRFAIVSADLSGASNPTLTFETYYTIEQNWDYGFVQISTDGGETWQSLESARMDGTPNPSAYPTVQANLPGYSGDTNGTWVSQSFDLSAYADEGTVLIGFRYVTDWAFVSQGWYIRNVSVAGNAIPTDTPKAFMSLGEATNSPIEYQFTFIGVTHRGTFRVHQLDARTFTTEEEQELEAFFEDTHFAKVIVASTWAAQPGESGRVPVGIQLEFDDEYEAEEGHEGEHEEGHEGEHEEEYEAE